MECNSMLSYYDRRFTEQFIKGLDDEAMIGKIQKELTELEDIDEAISDWVLIWVQRVETQRVQKRCWTL